MTFQESLWLLSPDDFNIWRRNNDLPRLLKYFKKRLPLFEEWMSEFKISDKIFLSAPHTGEWFIGESKRKLTDHLQISEFKPSASDYNHFTAAIVIQGNSHQPIEIVYLPYIKWGQLKTKDKDFISSYIPNFNFSNQINYTSWYRNSKDNQSHAKLLGEYEVLKLGQTQISSDVNISDRNLDFVDLDFLEILGESHGSTDTRISFCSCREIIIRDGSLHHFTFTCCELERLKIYNSYIQDFCFWNCKLIDPLFVHSRINGFTFKKGFMASPSFNGSDIQRFDYSTYRKNTFSNFSSDIDLARRLRYTFQGLGKRNEASKYYVQERCFERKDLWHYYLRHGKDFPKRSYFSLLIEFQKKRRKNQTDTLLLVKIFFLWLFYYLKVLINPVYLFRLLKHKAKYSLSLTEYLLWGYGERPSNIVIFICLNIFSFSSIYYFFGPTKDSIINSIYFSSITFTTLTYGDILPNNDFIKFICSLEALSGIIFLGVLVGAFANKVKY